MSVLEWQNKNAAEIENAARVSDQIGSVTKLFYLS